MDTVPLPASLLQAWSDHWPAVATAMAGGVSEANGETVMARLLAALRAVGQAVYAAWLQSAESAAETLERDGQLLRYKLTGAKTFLTPLGPVTLGRRLYQADRGGPTFVPLDAAWGMVDRSATPEIREIAPFLLATMTAREARQVLGKVALCQPSESLLKDLAAEFGGWLAEHPEAVAAAREAEPIPDGTRVVCASLDGTMVRLDEPGPPPGRPAAGAKTVAPTCFKTAMVGTVTCYGEVPADSATPKRLQTKYASQMPEEGMPTFRRDFEAEVANTLARCGPAVTRVLVLDGARALWRYVESQPLFADFEPILDFHHAVEHLTVVSEALFGKGTPGARHWWRRYRRKLLEHDDGPRRVLRAIALALKRVRRGAAARETVREQQRFFANNRDRMTYGSFRARGLPIGSGPVEAAGKVLVKQRLGRSGMRWSRTGGQAILSARTVVQSDRWSAVWKQHREIATAA